KYYIFLISVSILILYLCINPPYFYEVFKFFNLLISSPNEFYFEYKQIILNLKDKWSHILYLKIITITKIDFIELLINSYNSSKFVVFTFLEKVKTTNLELLYELINNSIKSILELLLNLQFNFYDKLISEESNLLNNFYDKLIL